jgi:hypothetical protein
MKVVEGCLATLIADILVKNQSDNGIPVTKRVVGSPVSRIRTQQSANDDVYAVKRPLMVRACKAGSKLFVFFDFCVKTCAKSARFSFKWVKAVSVNKRQRAALAACFFGFFSLFPSDTHCANLSTTP